MLKRFIRSCLPSPSPSLSLPLLLLLLLFPSSVNRPFLSARRSSFSSSVPAPPLSPSLPSPSLPFSSSSPPLSLSSSLLPIPRLLSYNVHSLSFYSTDPRALSRSYSIRNALSDFIKNQDIICLQETHLASADSLALSYLSGCVVSRNNACMGKAGTIIVDTPSLLQFYSGVDVPLPECARGRVQLRRYTSTLGRPSFQVFNAYFKSGGDYTYNSGLVKAMLSAEASCPTFLCGDLNFVDNKADSTSTSPSFPTSAFSDLWSSFKERFSLYEPLHDSHTYFHVTNDPSSPHSVSSRLDRFLLPALLFRNPIVSPVVSIASHPTNLSPTRPSPVSFSDHLPIHISYEGDPVERSGRPTIPTWLAEAPEFASNLREIWTRDKAKGAYKALKRYKESLFLAAKVTRKQKVENMSLSLLLSHHISMLRHINAPVQDASHISYLCDVCPSLLPLVSNSSGRYVDCGLLVATQALLSAPPPPSSHSPSLTQGSTLGNRAKFLSKQAPSSRERVGPLRSSSDSPEAISDEDRSKVAGTYWSKVWGERCPSPPDTLRSGFLENYNKTVDPSLCTAPDLDQIQGAISATGNTTAGPDGISFAAWRAAPDLAGPILLRVLQALSVGQPPPRGFNKGLLFLLPKKHTGLVSDTRPLSVTNTDNRILAAAVARAVLPAALDVIDPAQKGFLPGRQGSDHIQDVNRFFYEGVEANQDRLLFLLDTAKAFDSIDHRWLHMVLVKLQFPSWFRRFVVGALTDVSVSPVSGAPPLSL